MILHAVGVAIHDGIYRTGAAGVSEVSPPACIIYIYKYVKGQDMRDLWYMVWECRMCQGKFSSVNFLWL